MVVIGEAGVGKTALVRAALGAELRVGEAFPALGWLPYLPLRRAFPDVVDSDWTGDADFIAQRLGERLAGAVLLLDDAQWADADTVAVVEAAAARARLIATVRQEDPLAEKTIERLVAAGFVRLDLAPLEADDAAALAGRLEQRLTTGTRAAIARRSGGNPLYIEELVRAGGQADTLKLALGTRLDALPAAARQGLLLLATADQPLPERLVPGADELHRAALVDPDRSTTLRVRHRLIAELAAEFATEDELRAAHRRLLDNATAPGERSRHLLGLGDRAGAFTEAQRAADHAATPGERLAHLLLACECAPSGELATLLLRTATAANDAGDPAQARRLLDRLPAAENAGCVALVQRGRASFELGDVEGWRHSVTAGVEAARTPREHVYFAGEQAAIAYFLDSDAARAADLAIEAVGRARAEQVPHSSVLRMLGTAQYMLGDPAWQATLTDAVAQGRCEQDVAGTFAALNNLISAHESAGIPAEGMQLADDAAAEAAGLRLGFWERHFRTRRLSLALHAGDYRLVDRLGHELLDQPLLPRSREEVTHALVVSLADRGRMSEAMSLAETIRASPGVRPSDYHSARTAAFHVARRWRAVLAERDPFLAASPVPSVRTLLAPLFAWAAYRLGRDLDGADEQLLGWGLLAGVTPELAGIALLRAERYGAAVAQFDAAAAAYRPFHHRGAIRCGLAAAEALRRTGPRDAVERRLAELECDATERGLAPALAEIARLRASRSSADRVRAAARLSPREAEVLDLVGEGWSETEVARHLGVAVRTVQSHLASARRKLGATTRHHAVGQFDAARGRDAGAGPAR